MRDLLQDAEWAIHVGNECVHMYVGCYAHH
jgi:hypothetical protein